MRYQGDSLLARFNQFIKEMKLAVCIWGGHTQITETVDWDYPKGDVSQFIWMSQDHTNYNMSLISVQVKASLILKRLLR